MSISALLEQTLDLIGAEDNTNTPAVAPSSSSGKTAASILLEEKRRSKEKIEHISNINFNVPKVHSRGPASDMFDQIATSTVEAPKYWLSKKDKSVNNGSAANKKYSAAKPSKHEAMASAGGKKKSQDRSKGEDYQDRLQGKMAAKMAKQKMKNKLKG